ncbi:MAG: hypothetical protein HYV53_00445 [Parcubacteria group bacterium]|nr:hypothetical protein [Parcubacteria group bacterium]
MKKLSPKQKASLALAALKGEKISRPASDYQVNPNLIWKWTDAAGAWTIFLRSGYGGRSNTKMFI